MARVEEITWSEKQYSPRSLLDAYHDRLPVYALVTTGHFGQNEIETISSNQMIRIDSVVEQRRILVEDTKGQFYSIPDTFPVKFQVKEKKKKIKKRTLAEVVKRYKLPVPISSDAKHPWSVTVTNRRLSGNSMPHLLVIAAFNERFFRLNTIHEGVIDRRVGLLPLNIDIRMQLAERLKGEKTVWEDVTHMYDTTVNSLRIRSIQAPTDILIYERAELQKRFPRSLYDLIMTSLKRSEINNNKNRPESREASELSAWNTQSRPNQNGRLANGRPAGNLASATQTDDESSLVTDSGTHTRTKITKGVHVESNGIRPRPTNLKNFKPLRISSNIRTDGYFSDNEIRHASFSPGLTRTRIYSSTGDLWPGEIVRSDRSLSNQARQRRLRSSSLSRLDNTRHYGRVFSDGTYNSTDYNLYGTGDSAAIFRHRNASLYRRRDEPLTPDSVFSDDSTGRRRATVIRLRNKHDDSRGYSTMESTNSGVELSLQPIQRSNSFTYTGYRGDVDSPALSMALGSNQDINIATLQRSGNQMSASTLVSMHGAGHVLRQGRTHLTAPEDEELLHIEIQGADKEWTLKQKRPRNKIQRNVSDASSVSSIYVGLDDDDRFEDRRLKHGVRVQSSLHRDDRGLSNMHYADNEQRYIGKITIPNLNVRQHKRDVHVDERRGPRTSKIAVREERMTTQRYYSDDEDFSRRVNNEDVDAKRSQRKNGIVREEKVIKKTERRYNDDDDDDMFRDFEDGRGRERWKDVQRVEEVTRLDRRGEGIGSKMEAATRSGGQKSNTSSRTIQVEEEIIVPQRRHDLYEGDRNTRVERRSREVKVRKIQPPSYQNVSRGEYSQSALVRRNYDVPDYSRETTTHVERDADSSTAINQQVEIEQIIRSKTELEPIQAELRFDWNKKVLSEQAKIESVLNRSVSSTGYEHTRITPPGITHISKRFSYYPVMQRYKNRVHSPDRRVPSSSTFSYTSKSGLMSDRALFNRLTSLEEEEGQELLDKLPDYVPDGSQSRTIDIGYTSDDSQGTITPEREGTSLLDSSHERLNREGRAADRNESLHDDNMDEGRTGQHVQVIRMDEDRAVDNHQGTTQSYETSEIFIFRDSTGAKYDTIFTDMIADSKTEAMHELDRMVTNSSQDLTEITESTTANSSRQDDNNNITSVGLASKSAGVYDKQSTAESRSLKLTGDNVAKTTKVTSNIQAGKTSNQHKEAPPTLPKSGKSVPGTTQTSSRLLSSQIEQSPTAVKNSVGKMTSYSTSYGQSYSPMSGRSATSNVKLSTKNSTTAISANTIVSTSNVKTPATISAPTETAVTGSYTVTSGGSSKVVSYPRRNTSPGGVKYQSAGRPVGPSRGIKNAVVRANSKGPTDVPNDELREILRIRSFDINDNDDNKTTATRKTDAQSVSKVGTALRIERNDLDLEKTIATTSTSKTITTSVQSKENHQTLTTSGSNVPASSKMNMNAQASSGGVSTVGVVKRVETSYPLVKHSATPPMVIQSATPPTVKQSATSPMVKQIVMQTEIVKTSSKPVSASKSERKLGKFLMRHKEGSVQSSKSSKSKATKSGYSSSGRNSDMSVDYGQDRSLPANEEMDIENTDGMIDLDKYLKPEDTISQASYGSSKLEHFSYGYHESSNTRF